MEQREQPDPLPLSDSKADAVKRVKDQPLRAKSQDSAPKKIESNADGATLVERQNEQSDGGKSSGTASKPDHAGQKLRELLTDRKNVTLLGIFLNDLLLWFNFAQLKQTSKQAELAQNQLREMITANKKTDDALKLTRESIEVATRQAVSGEASASAASEANRLTIQSTESSGQSFEEQQRPNVVLDSVAYIPPSREIIEDLTRRKSQTRSVPVNLVFLNTGKRNADSLVTDAGVFFDRKQAQEFLSAVIARRLTGNSTSIPASLRKATVVKGISALDWAASEERPLYPVGQVGYRDSISHKQYRLDICQVLSLPIPTAFNDCPNGRP